MHPSIDSQFPTYRRKENVGKKYWIFRFVKNKLLHYLWMHWMNIKAIDRGQRDLNDMDIFPMQGLTDFQCFPPLFWRKTKEEVFHFN